MQKARSRPSSLGGKLYRGGTGRIRPTAVRKKQPRASTTVHLRPQFSRARIGSCRLAHASLRDRVKDASDAFPPGVVPTDANHSPRPACRGATYGGGGENHGEGLSCPRGPAKSLAKGASSRSATGRFSKTAPRGTPQVSEGDRVLFNDWAGTEVQFNSEELLILHEDEILAVLA